MKRGRAGGPPFSASEQRTVCRQTGEKEEMIRSENRPDRHEQVYMVTKRGGCLPLAEQPPSRLSMY
ncbi:MAG: hypothetical protein K6G83_15775 [Lachnospiraceae bacterium]|nr:hypothetical protein [Lachnospiraceae bacterium]